MIPGSFSVTNKHIVKTQVREKWELIHDSKYTSDECWSTLKLIIRLWVSQIQSDFGISNIFEI